MIKQYVQLNILFLLIKKKFGTKGRRRRVRRMIWNIIDGELINSQL